jgi:hypothetical protein
MQQRREPRELDKHSPRIFFVSSRLIQPFAVRPSRQARFQQITHQTARDRALSTFRHDGATAGARTTALSASALCPDDVRRRARRNAAKSSQKHPRKNSVVTHRKATAAFSRTRPVSVRARPITDSVSSWSPAAVIGGCQPHTIKRWRKKSTPRARLYLFILEIHVILAASFFGAASRKPFFPWLLRGF